MKVSSLKLKRKIENLSSLIDLGSVINSTLDLDQLLKTVLSLAEEVLHAEASSIFLLNDEIRTVELKIARGPVGERLMKEGLKLEIGEGFAGWIAETGNSVLIANAKRDKRFLPHIDEKTGFDTRTILAAPLKNRNRIIGVAELFNRRGDGRFNAEDLELFETFCNQAAVAVDNARMHAKLIQQQRIEQELELASVVQKSFLPDVFPEHPGLALAGLSHSARNVGGDFYDYIIFDSERVGVIVGDVSGKGVPAALHMARIVSDFKFQAARLVEPWLTMRALNELLVKRAHQGSFITALYILIDTGSMTARFSSAGHCPFFRLRPGKPVEVVNSVQEAPLGIRQAIGFSEDGFTLDEGESLLLITDGVIEARNQVREQLGIAGLRQLIEDLPRNTPEEMITSAVLDVQGYSAGTEQHDDLTLVSIRVKP